MFRNQGGEIGLARQNISRAYGFSVYNIEKKELNAIESNLFETDADRANRMHDVANSIIDILKERYTNDNLNFKTTNNFMPNDYSLEEYKWTN